MPDYDLVVVGAGTAGLTAAMFGARYGLQTVVVDQMGSGGQTLNVDKIENFPGFPQGVAGYDLGPLLQEHAEAAGAEFLLDQVWGIENDGREQLIRCDENEIRSKAVVVACGSALRSLGIPGEQEFLGKGVSHCASCDAAFFIGMDVGVIGSGDSALDEALVLTEHAGRVLVFHQGNEMQSQKSIRDKAGNVANVEFFPNSAVEEILGDVAVSAIRLREANSGEVRLQHLSGVFIYVGLEPNSRFLEGVVDLDLTGHIVTDILMRTSLPGIFAAGDIRQNSVAQLVAAAGDGATAAISAYRYIKGLSQPPR